MAQVRVAKGAEAPRRGRPPGSTSGATRARLLQAAREAFARAGYRGASIAEIVGDAGVSPPVLYHYFESKAGLYGAVTAEVYDVILARFEAAAARATNLADQLDLVIGASLELHLEDSTLGGFLTAAPVMIDEYPELQFLRAELARPTRWLEDLVRRSGEVAPEQVRTVVRVLVAQFIGLSRLATSGMPVTEYAEVVQAVRRLLLVGLLSPGADRRA